MVNHFSGSEQGAFNISSSVTLEVASQSNNLIVGIINPHSNSVAFSLYYTKKEEINIVIIIISVIGGIILIAMLIAAIYIVRRMSNSRR